MNEKTLRQNLQTISGDEPTHAFVEGLREHLRDDNASTTGSATDAVVFDLTATKRPSTDRRLTPLRMVAAVALLATVILGGSALREGPTPIETATATEAMMVSEAWVNSIVANDRDAFAALHASPIVTNDTLMGYSREVGLLTPDRVAELYFDGFDAFQISIETDDDFLRADECVETADDVVRCTLAASILGTDEYTYTLDVELTVEDGLVTRVRFGNVATNPPDLRDDVQTFFDSVATDEDRACLLLGFNTLGCGEHDSDFMRRYVAYYETQRT